MDTYILSKDKKVIKEPNLDIWSKSRAKSNWLVQKNVIPDKNIEISTVFLGIDHSFSGAKEPLLFETMVFGGPLDQEMDRCSTYKQAERMHEVMCNRVKETMQKLVEA